MPDQTTPLVRGLSVKDLADPETIRERAIRLSSAVTAEEATANLAEVARQMAHLGVPHPAPGAVREAIRREQDAVREELEAGRG